MSYPEAAAAQPAMTEAAPFSAPPKTRIRRPGARPLVFSGSELAMVMSFTPELPYWYEVNIYRTDTQRFVLSIRKFYQSETEEDLHHGWEFDTIDDVFQALETYDASKDVKINLETSQSSPAEMMAMAMELRAKVEAARVHFAGLIGQLFVELETAMPNA